MVLAVKHSLGTKPLQAVYIAIGKLSKCRLGVFGLGKVRLRIALPVMQLLIGIVAFYANHQFSWVFFSDYKGPPTPRVLVLAKLALSAKVFCMGVSAPALLFWFFGASATESRPDTQPLSVVGFNMGEILFFLGVVVLWFSIGRAIERHLSCKPSSHERLSIPDRCNLILLMVWGVVLLTTDIWFLRDLSLSTSGWTPNSFVDFLRIAVMSMALIWSMLLIVLPARIFAQASRYS